jgi:hypothetical protein
MEMLGEIMSDYNEFIATKTIRPKTYGFDVATADLNQGAWDWQQRGVQWALKRGRAALFWDTGLGKTISQLMWAEQVAKHTSGRVLLHCPVGVRHQTKREAERFGIGCDVEICDSGDSMPTNGIVIANYEKLHKFDTKDFSGVVLDESSILKSFTGAIKQSLCNNWNHVDFRLACTATPSPNDHMELGNHAQFLGVMNSNEMLSRWFYNDTMKAGGYKILPHGEADFWEWVATWAACVSLPSDIGGSDDGYILPALQRHDHLVIPQDQTPQPGQLFHTDVKLTATTVHREKRRSTPDRCAKVVELVNAEPNETWLIWCDTDYEGDALKKALPDAVNLKGSDKESSKEDKLRGFSEGSIKWLISKPTVAGFGMNWQHCARMAFIGLSYSYEQYYQAVRRCWRFGQQREVIAHVVMAEGEQAIMRTNERKQSQHAEMQKQMRAAINRSHELATGGDLKLKTQTTNTKLEIPEWLSKRKTAATHGQSDLATV